MAWLAQHKTKEGLLEFPEGQQNAARHVLCTHVARCRNVRDKDTSRRHYVRIGCGRMFRDNHLGVAEQSGLADAWRLRVQLFRLCGLLLVPPVGIYASDDLESRPNDGRLIFWPGSRNSFHVKEAALELILGVGNDLQISPVLWPLPRDLAFPSSTEVADAFGYGIPCNEPVHRYCRLYLDVAVQRP
jgi:hypothetical protein